MSAYVRVAHSRESGPIDPVDHIDCDSFAVNDCGVLLLSNKFGLVRAFASGQWIYATMRYPDTQEG